MCEEPPNPSRGPNNKRLLVWLYAPALPFWFTILVTSYRRFFFAHGIGSPVFGTLAIVWAIVGLLWCIWIIKAKNETVWIKTWIVVCTASAFYGCVLLNYRAITRPLGESLLR